MTIKQFVKKFVPKEQFDDETPHIDHDRSCCGTKKHCWQCTRGFVHFRCNVHEIMAYEFVEQDCGLVGPRLADYKKRFPRRQP